LAEDLLKIHEPESETNSLLGYCDICFDVKDVTKSHEFYSSLGFKHKEGNPDKDWVVLSSGNLRLGLFPGDEQQMTINFRGGDVAQIAKHISDNGYKLKQEPIEEEDGSIGASMDDPDGYLLYFNS